MARDQHLIRRGNQFYLRLPVPRPLRRLGLFVSGTGKGKDYIVEPLGPSHDLAQIEASRRTADYRALFARAAVMTLEAVQAELVAIKRAADQRRAVADLPSLLSEMQR